MLTPPSVGGRIHGEEKKKNGAAAISACRAAH